MSRGLTLIELLASLVVLSGVMLAVATWTRASTTLAAGASRTVHEQAGIESVLRLIAEDVATGDFEPQDRRRNDPHVEVDDGVLIIRTRGTASAGEPGPVVHTYSLDRVAGELVLRAKPQRGRSTERALLGDVEAFACVLEEDEEDEVALTVTLTGITGATYERRYTIE